MDFRFGGVLEVVRNAGTSSWVFGKEEEIVVIGVFGFVAVFVVIEEEEDEEEEPCCRLVS